MKTTNKPVIFGVALTVLFHGGLAFYTVHSGLKYIYPPPEEKAITMEFPPEEEPLKPIEVGSSEELRSPEPEPELPENPVKKAEAPVKVETPKPNEAAESTVADDGDVETPEPVKPKEINRRALFSAADNRKKDTLAPQVARDASDEMSEGHSHGITENGPTEGAPSAHLYGRDPVGDLPLPKYTVQDRGMITVFIWVNHDGKVERAEIDVQHTNISSAVLREETRKAALAARFSPVAGGAELQKGSITYIFKLK